ncbi:MULTISPECIES: LuxR C-terminal-related transcriptional regulator [unclassified Aeromicrobium]|uniref:helix-turn-helix transcriptional regulator n=1 Tax=unclassified Aeromicrobium TaxID=2633570 RepID=UPI00396B27A7
MTTRLDGAQDLSDLARSIVEGLRAGASALVTGPSGTGKSSLLRTVQDRLHATGVEAHTVRAEVWTPGDGDVDEATAVLLVDDLESAPEDLLGRLSAHAGNGGRVVAMFETGRHPRAYSTLALSTVYGSHPLGRAAAAVHRTHLTPLDDESMARFLHAHAGEEPLDSHTLRAITDLALGRRAWAMDLLNLARAGQVQADPFPTINPLLAPGDAPLPALQSLRAALATVSPECAATAVALSGIEPLDELGLSALVDPAIVETLTVAGVLVPTGGSQQLAVPAFVATALRQRSPFDQVERCRREIATGLLGQELIGVPLSERDTLYCVRALAPDEVLEEDLAEALRHLVVRAVTRLTTFGEAAQVRAAVLRLAAHRLELPPLARARALAALGNTNEALMVVDAIEDDDSEGRLATRFVRSVLLAETGETPVPGGADDVRDQDAATELVLRWWNRTEPLGDATRLVRAIADQHPDPAVAALATLLLDLDAVWAGLVPPHTSTLHAPKPLPAATMPTSPALSDVTGTLLVAQALVLLMIGEASPRRDSLLELAARLPDRDHHDRWLRHIVASSTAVTFGEMDRGLLEWQLFAGSVPRLVPARLRHYVDRVGAALEAVSDPTREPDDLGQLSSEYPYRILLYFAGLHGPLQALRTGLEPKSGALPLIRLARAHLDATHERNPAQLMRIAGIFREYDMWLPSAYALGDARRIYVGRRASGKAHACDDELAAVREQIRQNAPWLSAEAAVSDLPVTLTPRELEAARLAARGLRNRDIAEALECGVRTVESHLAQARAKLGAGSRDELARLLPPDEDD